MFTTQIIRFMDVGDGVWLIYVNVLWQAQVVTVKYCQCDGHNLPSSTYFKKIFHFDIIQIYRKVMRNRVWYVFQTNDNILTYYFMSFHVPSVSLSQLSIFFRTNGE